MNEINSKLSEYLDLIARRRKYYLPEPTIKVVTDTSIIAMYGGNRDASHIAGLAVSSTNTIYLNQKYLNSHLDSMLNNTLPHELCHILAYRLHGEMATPRGRYGNTISHGRLWSKEMKEVFGLYPWPFHVMGQENIWVLDRKK